MLVRHVLVDRLGRPRASSSPRALYHPAGYELLHEDALELLAGVVQRLRSGVDGGFTPGGSGPTGEVDRVPEMDPIGMHQRRSSFAVLSISSEAWTTFETTS